ncbi:MAG: formylmethanofuran dehydrogenase subunit E family protein [Candidatus Omnitrophica bacterium]|nr:formylmethanofuran dehydrogenase subunit E family protein [Candidatus Omnitrophota bacterium]
MNSLKSAVEFHGHLGPYLALGLRAGVLGLRRIGCKKYFGLSVKVYGATQKPRSCLVDGLQLSTGATYGKGNIHKHKAKRIKIVMLNLHNNKSIQISLKKTLVHALEKLKGHADSEKFAKRLFKINNREIFELK